MGVATQGPAACLTNGNPKAALLASVSTDERSPVFEDRVL